MNKIKIGILGFGKTGRVVTNEFLKDPAFDVKWVIQKSKENTGKYASRLLGFEYDCARIFSSEDLPDNFYKENFVDIIVDFSHQKGYAGYMQASDFGTRIISAISRYNESDIENLKKMSENTAVLYSPNITLGINFLLVASQILQKIAPHADIEIVEEHFREKEETSGTALKLANALGLEEKRLNSIRVGGIVGKHEIIFGLPNQTIRLIHESINKAAFGQGAIFAAKWLFNKPNGYYSMEKIIIDMFNDNIPVY